MSDTLLEAPEDAVPSAVDPITEGERLLWSFRLCDTAINLERLEIRADFLRWVLIERSRNPQTAPGGLDIWNARIDGRLNLSGLSIRHRLRFRNCRIYNPIDAIDAEFRSLFFEGGTCDSINLSRSRVDGNLTFCDDLQANGSLMLSSVTVRGDLRIQRASFLATPEHNIFETALDLAGAKIAGSWYLTDDWPGEIDEEPHGLDAPDTPPLQRAEGDATRDDPDATASASTPEPTRIYGRVFANNLEVGRNVEIRGVRILGAIDAEAQRNPETGAITYSWGFMAEGARINGALLIRNDAEIGGGLRLLGARISEIEFNQVHFFSQAMPIEDPESRDVPHLPAVDLRLARIAGRLRIDPECEVTGQLALELAHARTVELFLPDKDGTRDAGRPAAWHRYGYALDGFTYERVITPDGPAGEQLLRWLGAQSGINDPDFATQPWHQAAKALDAMGLELDARNIRIEAARRHAAAEQAHRWHDTRAQFKGARFPRNLVSAATSALANLAFGAFSYLYGALISYGHNPLRAGMWVLLCVACGSALLLQQAHLFVEAKPDTGPPFNAFLLSVDLFVPVVKMGWDGAWIPDPLNADADWLWYFLAIFRTLGWIVAGFAVAGLTGLARK